MRKICLYILVIIFPLTLFSQDTSWKKLTVDENLQVWMPAELTKLDTSVFKNGEKMRFLVYKAEFSNYTLGLTVTPNDTKIGADNPDAFKKAMEGFVKGACNSARERGLTCNSSDTIIDALDAKKFILSSGTTDTDIMQVNYCFLVNDKIYMLTTSVINLDKNNPAVREASTKFLNSIHFNKDDIKEKRFDSSVESRSYKIGQLVGMVLGGIIALLIVIYFIRRLSRK